MRETMIMKASITESAVSDIRSRIAQLPPPKPVDKLLRIEEATMELYADLRGAILAGHSVASIADSVLVPAGWTASAERIRRALLGIARQRKDMDLATRIGGLRPRRHRAKPKASTTTTMPKTPKRGHGAAAATVGVPTTVSDNNKTQLLSLE